MALILPWMPLAWVIAIAVFAVLSVIVRRRRKKSLEGSLPIAHSDRLTGLPGYRSALFRYRALLASAASVVAIAIISSVVLSSRPAVTTVLEPDLANRDIVLCLDISGSMVSYDAEIVKVFAELSKRFTGERISLVLFNASAVTYFPLTTDYPYIARQLDRLQVALSTKDSSIYSGTQLGDGSSLIGDGLASCALRFDAPGSERSRSIILATDNMLAGRPIFTMPEAGALAASRKIRVYGINPGDSPSKNYLDALAVQFRTVIDSTGGAYFGLADPAAIPEIVGKITAEQSKVLKGIPQLVSSDIPEVPFYALFLSVCALFVASWRLRR